MGMLLRRPSRSVIGFALARAQDYGSGPQPFVIRKETTVFAPKAAKPQTKEAESSSGRLTPRLSPHSGHRLGYDPVERALFLQRSSRNQAALRLLARRDLSPTGSEPPRQDGHEAVQTGRTRSGISWDSSEISAFPAERASLAGPLSVGAEQAAVQPDLAIGPIDDLLEREAARVADPVPAQVTPMPDSRGRERGRRRRDASGRGDARGKRP